jgi:hypothetical protein
MPNASLVFKFNHCRRCSGCRQGFIFCHTCETAKTVSNFYRDKRGADLYHAGCRDCRRRHARTAYREGRGLLPPTPRRPRSGYRSPRAERLRSAMVETVRNAGPGGISLRKLAADLGLGRTWTLEMVHKAVSEGRVIATRDEAKYHAWILTAAPTASA